AVRGRPRAAARDEPRARRATVPRADDAAARQRRGRVVLPARRRAARAVRPRPGRGAARRRRRRGARRRDHRARLAPPPARLAALAASIRLGTRGSALALAQARQVAAALEAFGSAVEIVTVRTSGDEAPGSLSSSGRIAAATREAGSE